MSTILHELNDGLFKITLNRPEKLNALDAEAFIALDEAVSFAQANVDKIGCVLITGAGRCFSTGNDLEDRSEAFRSDEGTRFRSRVIEALAHLPMPVIAAVHGYCLTGGLELVLAADIIIADESARFGDTHAKFDLLSLPALTHRLVKRVGRAKALEIWISGRFVSGRDAVTIGLANMYALAGELEAMTDAFVKDVLANSWRSHRGFKALADRAEMIGPGERLAEDLGSDPRMGPDAMARMARMRKA